MYDRRRGIVLYPLVRQLGIFPYKRSQGEALKAIDGKVIYFSYRLGTEEAPRLRRLGLGKSTVHRTVQLLGQVPGCGTKEKPEMRLALASVGTNRPFEPIGFWIDGDWSSLRQDLEARHGYRKLEVLLPEGGRGLKKTFFTRGCVSSAASGTAVEIFPLFLIKMDLKTGLRGSFESCGSIIPCSL
jgi:hypothetical protein